MAMYAIAAQILKKVRGSGRGSVFTPKDFLGLGTRAAVDQALSRLAQAGVLHRVGRGLYHYPENGQRLGTLSPAADVLARAVARKTASRLNVLIRQVRSALSHDDRKALARHAGFAPDWMRPIVARIARGPIVLKRSLHGPDAGVRPARTTAAPRVAMMWQLAVDAWSFKGENVGESRLQRDVVRVLRGGR